jgi:hypothetical protein
VLEAAGCRMLPGGVPRLVEFLMFELTARRADLLPGK